MGHFGWAAIFVVGVFVSIGEASACAKDGTPCCDLMGVVSGRVFCGCCTRGEGRGGDEAMERKLWKSSGL